MGFVLSGNREGLDIGRGLAEDLLNLSERGLDRVRLKVSVETLCGWMFEAVDNRPCWNRGRGGVMAPGDVRRKAPVT
jgi:hypothetical protein